MLALQPIDTVPHAFRPDPVTQEEAAAMFRAVLNLFGKWELTDEQAATLLDMPVRSYRRWKAEGAGRVSRDGAARLSNLMGIHKALRIIFSEAQRGYAWIKAGNAAFAGASALDVMLGGELTEFGAELSEEEKATIEAAIKEAEDAIRNGDLDTLKAKSEALGTAAQKLGEKVYAKQQAESGEAQAAGGEAKKDDSDVVDAEFTEVKDKK